MNQTELVLMPGADYRAVCENIRAVLGETETIKSGYLPGKVLQTYSAGMAAGEKEWADRFYMVQLAGNGENNISVEVPFAPDCITFGYSDPVAYSSSFAYIGFQRDFRTFSRIGGSFGSIINSVNQTANLKNNTIENLIELKDRTITFKAPANYDKNVLWKKQSQYRLIAVKYVEEGVSDEELLKRYVLHLPDTGGTVTLSSRRFGDTGLSETAFRAFTEQHKPGWTFVIE